MTWAHRLLPLDGRRLRPLITGQRRTRHWSITGRPPPVIDSAPAAAPAAAAAAAFCSSYCIILRDAGAAITDQQSEEDLRESSDRPEQMSPLVRTRRHDSPAAAAASGSAKYVVLAPRPDPLS